MVDEYRDSLASTRGRGHLPRKLGQLVSFDEETQMGWIEGDDGDLYYFPASEVAEPVVLKVGLRVQFLGDDGQARQVTEPPADTDPETPAHWAVPDTAEPQAPERPDTALPSEMEGADVAASGAPDDEIPVGDTSVDQLPHPAAMPRTDAIRGKLVSFDPDAETGWIQGSDGNLYVFKGSDVRSDFALPIGSEVMFQAHDQVAATQIVAVTARPPAESFQATLARQTAPEPAVPTPQPPKAAAPADGAGSTSAVLGKHGTRFLIGVVVLVMTSLSLLLWRQSAKDGPQPADVATPPVGDAREVREPDETPDPEGAALPALSETTGSGEEYVSANGDGLETSAAESTSDSGVVPIDPPEDASVITESGSAAEESQAETGERATSEPVERKPTGPGTAPAPVAVKPGPTPKPVPVASQPPPATEPEPEAEAGSRTASSPSAAPPVLPEPSARAPDTDDGVITGAELPLSEPPRSGPLKSWWGQPQPDALNLKFAGHLSTRPAIVLAFDSVLTDVAAVSLFIAVTDASGQPVPGQWELGPTGTTLVFYVEPGRYHVSLGAGLRDSSGRALGRRLGGTVRVL